MRFQSAILLTMFCAAATALAQHPGAARAGGGATNGVQRSASPTLAHPFPNPYLISDLTFAQRLGAVVAGSANGSPAFWGPAPFGATFFPGQNGSLGFGAPGFLPWFCRRRNNAPGFAGSGFSPVAYPAFAYESSIPDYYPTAQSNGTVVLPPQYIPEFAPPLTISAVRASQEPNRPVEPHHLIARESGTGNAADSTPDEYGIRIYQAPGRGPIPEDDHPPLVALKNGWSYTVTAYWVKGNTIHFITTQGNHIHAPLNMLDRLYPPHKKHKSSEGASHPVDASLP